MTQGSRCGCMREGCGSMRKEHGSGCASGSNAMHRDWGEGMKCKKDPKSLISNQHNQCACILFWSVHRRTYANRLNLQTGFVLRADGLEDMGRLLCISGWLSLSCICLKSIE